MKLGNLFRNLFPGHEDAERLLRARLDSWADWLQPLPGEGGVGRDPGYEDLFFSLREETQKLSAIDDAFVARACEQLLRETGKDLRLAGYYAFARLRQDGPGGLADALELVAALIERFGEQLMPARAEAKKGALDMLATGRMLELLDGGRRFEPADLKRAMAALDMLIAATANWPEPARPSLQGLVTRLQRHGAPVDTAQSDVPASSLITTIAPTQTIASTRDLIEQGRAMAVWLRAQEHGYLPSVRLVRSLRWDTLHDLPPADATARTRLPPPRSELRQQMRRLLLQKQWHELLERVEAAFMEAANHLWFDLQCYQHLALSHVGSPYDGWSELLRADVALFLQRLPGIERLAFNDATPFCEDATLEWIARHAVVRDLDAGETVAPLPVSAEDDGKGGWQEIEAQGRDLLARGGVEAAFGWLEKLPDMKSDRHRYLQRLVMARLADQAGRPETALALLTALDSTAQSLPLQCWEPALVFEVKQLLVRAMRAMSTRKDADKPFLHRRIAELQSELIVLDPARALTLA